MTKTIYTTPADAIARKWRIEKRVANTEHWGVVGYAATRDEAARAARTVLGGASTGVRICQTDTPHRQPILIVGC